MGFRGGAEKGTQCGWVNMIEAKEKKQAHSLCTQHIVEGNRHI